jgi:hypothetical protein
MNSMKNLIAAAAEASERFGDDECEAHAAKIHALAAQKRTKATTLRHITKAWYYLSEVLECKSGFCEDYSKQYLRIIREEETGHRNFKPDGVTCGLSIADAVRLFAVKRIVEYLDGDTMPGPEQFLHTQRSCFYAAAFVAEFPNALREALTDSRADLDVIRAADYAELMKG